MLTVLRRGSGEVLDVELVGVIDESADFAKGIGDVAKELRVNLKMVTRINSEGVRVWMRYFQGLAGRQVKVQFHECSVPMVEQMNLVANFLCGGTVESLYLPFLCGNCKKELLGLFEAKALSESNFRIPTVKCPKCGNQAQFDEDKNSYFHFLRR